ncbi:MAG: hypothetical protein ACPGLV_15955 [Bacteroidia bacterium]
MRSISAAKKELRLIKKILDEFVIDYEQAQSEEDLSTKAHQDFSRKISEVYWKKKELETRLAGF